MELVPTASLPAVENQLLSVFGSDELSPQQFVYQCSGSPLFSSIEGPRGVKKRNDMDFQDGTHGYHGLKLGSHIAVNLV